jgi:hypothetical protein
MGIRGGDVDVRGALAAIMATLMSSTLVISVVWEEPVRAETCSALTERVRKEESGASGLPDCRAYEQVSPVAKNGLDSLGGPFQTHASPTGDRVTFYSLLPFPGVVGSSSAVPTYLGSRAPEADGWTFEGLQPPAAAGTEGRDVQLGVTEDLAKTILLAADPPLVPGVTPGTSNAYVRDNATGAYQLLASNVAVSDESAAFVGAASGDSRILFETSATQPTSNIPPVLGTNLYEWNEAMPVGQRVSLVGVVPPAGQSVCGGSSEPACEAASQGSWGGPSGGAHSRNYTQNTISWDGTRVFFTDIATGFVFMREPVAGRTVRVSAGVAPAQWLASTPSGSFIFYSEGPELYRFNVAEGKREALTSEAEGVLGALGVSDDGSYAYFAAPGTLAKNKNANGEEAVKGAANLYEWHQGTPTFIAILNEKDDWRGGGSIEGLEGFGPGGGNRSSRVTPDGRTILFSSTASLTPVYSSNGNYHFYLYAAERPFSASNPVCVSCNPRGVDEISGSSSPGSTRLGLEGETADVEPNPAGLFLTHNLSDAGDRVFFQSQEALVPGDVNGQLDVYEWERAGVGSCESTSVSFSAQDGGCLYVISTGQSPQLSYFGNADAEGENVFFFTRQSLVGQDQDENIDLYDARLRGGIPAQNPPPAGGGCAEESTCLGPSPSTSPVFGTPSSTTFSGTGNLPDQTPVPTKILTRAEKLAKALRACRSKSRSKRKVCEATARRRYGSKPKTKKAARGGGRHS